MTRRKHSTNVKKLRENALKREKAEESLRTTGQQASEQTGTDTVDKPSTIVSTKTIDGDDHEKDVISDTTADDSSKNNDSPKNTGSSFYKRVDKSSPTTEDTTTEDHDTSKSESKDVSKRLIDLDDLDLSELLTDDNITALRAAGSLSFDIQEDNGPDHSNDDDSVDDDAEEDVDDEDEDDEYVDDEDDLEDDDLSGEPTFDELQKDSEIIVDNGDNGAMKILDNLVVYEVDGWIDRNTGKPLSRMKLRQNPPVISFRQHVSGDEDGDQDSAVSLVVTRGLADQMSTMFAKIRDSYDGIEEKKRKPVTTNSIKEKIAMEWKYEPTKVVLTIVLIVLLIAVVVYGFIIG